MSATEDKLTALQSKRADQTGVILTPEQEAEIERFEAEKLRIRKELRDVRLGLNQEAAPKLDVRQFEREPGAPRQGGLFD